MHKYRVSFRSVFPSGWTGFRLILLVTVLQPGSTACGQPAPGDLFREYCCTNTAGDAGGAIRVGGRRGTSYPDRGSDFGYVNAWIDFPHALDLEHATRAELFVEKILSHNGTDGLAIQWNDGHWLPLPPPDTLPQPAKNYYHHICITVPIGLTSLNGGDDATNRFRLKVSPEHGWNWPQHLIYGVHLRVYYDPEQTPHVRGAMASPRSATELGLSVPLAVEVTKPIRRINRVDYVGLYKDVNWEGDGVYRQWHSFYYHGQLCHHIGTAVVAPFTKVWDTSWLPDQDEPIRIAARITDDSGLTYFTPASAELVLNRPGHSVELCEPYNVPENWVTRRGEFEQTINLRGDPARVVAARLCWSSWSPGYMNGLFLNGNKVLDAEGPRYRYFDHRVPITDLSLLRSGQNTVGTGMTPRHDGRMVHGMEVNWPGIQMLVQYRVP